MKSLQTAVGSLRPHWKLALLVLLAFTVRLYRIDYPLADWHSWRQADTASVTREYVKRGIAPLQPRYHDLSNVQSGQPNPEGYRMVEFPFVNVGVAWLLRLVPQLPLVATSRFVSVLFSIGALISLFFLVRDIWNQRIAYAAATFFAFLPYSVYYSRAILPEMPMVFFSTLSIAAFWWWLDKKQTGWFFVSWAALALALLLKPFVAFLGIVYAVMTWQQLRWRIWRRPLLFTFPLAFIPILWWRDWIQQYPAGIPANEWLYNGNKIRFRPAWFRWLFWERLGRLITGFSIYVLGLFAVWPIKKSTAILVSWWLGIGAYFVVFATGNVQHDYYQVMAIPIISITLGVGLVRAWDWLVAKVGQHSVLAVMVLVFAFAWSQTWTIVGGYFNVNNWEQVHAGERIDALTEPDALVIAPAFSDTKFLFQTNRRGWPIGFEIDKKIAAGADYYVTTALDGEAQELMMQYQTIEQTDEYLIFDLNSPTESEDGDSLSAQDSNPNDSTDTQPSGGGQ